MTGNTILSRPKSKYKNTKTFNIHKQNYVQM